MQELTILFNPLSSSRPARRTELTGFFIHEIMNVNELRLGNWVNDIGEDIDFQLWSLYCEDGNNKLNHYPISYFAPVPLTEEWLVKLGFKYDRQLDSNFLSDRMYKKTLRDEISEYYITYDHIDKVYKFILVTGSRFFKEIKHVHQLQNLYFALTGEELIIAT